LSISIGLSLTLAINSSLGHWVQSLGDWVKTSAGAKGDTSIWGISSIWESTIAIAKASKTKIVPTSIWESSIGILGLG